MQPVRRLEAKWIRSIAFLAAVALAACGGGGAGSTAAASPGQPGISAPTEPVVADPVASDPVVTTPAPAESPAAPALAVAFAAALGDPLAAVSQASIHDTPLLYVVADWTGVGADAAEQVVIRTPRGTVFASMQISFTEDQRGDVIVQVLPDGTRRVAYALQIWGTSIEQLSRTGDWSAQVSLVGGDLGATTRVTLAP